MTQHAVDQAVEPIYLAEPGGRLLYVNDAACRSLGYTRDELLALSLANIDPDCSPDNWTNRIALLKRRGSASVHSHHRRKDGSVFPVRIVMDHCEFQQQQFVLVRAADLTTHGAVEEAARENERRMRALVNESPFGAHIYELHSDGSLVLASVNESSQRILGVDCRPLIGKTVEEAFPLLCRTDIPDAYRQVAPTGKGFSRETIEYDEAGIRGCFEIHAFQIGRDCMAVLFRDVGERKRAEEALRNAHQQLVEIIEFLPDPTFVIDGQGKVIAWNQAIESLSGVPKQQMIGQGDHAYSVPFFGSRQPMLIDLLNQPLDHVDPTYAFVRRVGDKLYAESYLPQLHEGRGAHLWGMAAPLYDTHGKRWGAVEVIRDITEHKHDEESLRRTVATLRSVFLAAPTGIGIVANRTLLEVNDRILAMSGYTREELVGQSARILYPTQEDFDFVGQEKYRQIRQTGTGTVETRWRRKDGAIIDVLLSSTPLDPDNLQAGVTFTALDITDRKRAEEELRRTRDQAQAANQAKDRFLAAVSHELRTPLMPVMLLASSLEREPALPSELRQEMATIREHIGLEKRLVDDLLDFTAIYAGKLHLRFKQSHLHAALLAAVATCRPEIERKRLTLDVSLQAGRDRLQADPDRLTQIFWNLLQNAAKFTPAGGRIEVHTVDDDAQRILVRISDTGQGIDPQTMPRLFKPFEQGPRTTMQHYGGLGLGLAIAHTLTESHGGTIELASTAEHCGTTFHLRFPLIPDDTTPAPPPRLASARTDGEAKPPTETAKPPPMRILLVEDHDQTRQLLARLLQLEHHEVTAAAGMAEALAAAQTGTFDVVLSDIGLPDGSGLDLMRELQQRYHLSGIALSGFASQADQQAAKEAGFSEHLAKPVQLETLLQALQRARVSPS